MESTDKLRKYVSAFISPGAEADLLGIADEIEREIAERYMKLPVDADGVPIRVGDELCMVAVEDCVNMGTKHVVFAVAQTYVIDLDGHSFLSMRMRHVKQRTVEDVLEEFLIEFDEWDWNTGGNDRDNARKQLFAKYADELRNMGVGE